MSSMARGPQNFESTLRICSLLQSVRALYYARDSLTVRRVLEEHVVGLIGELVPADRIAIVMEGPENGGLAIGQPLLDAVVRERSGFCRKIGDKQIALTPLVVRSEVAGVLYLERSGALEFTEAEFLLAGAVAELASMALENVYQLDWLQSEVRRLESGTDLAEMLPGESKPMRELRDRVGRAAPAEATILITGESGTGKELVARAIHQKSARASKHFVAINCGALTETLLESELFGHERGAFTGAVGQKAGRLERAEGGTLFLDEVGEMPLSLQVKLLRVIQQREFERVGGTRTIPLDVRFIAATNRDLPEEIRRGAFRADLFYRLNVVSLRTPALRERAEDIVPLAMRFARQTGLRCGREIGGISPEARSLLRAYTWPGNVRELENAVESAIVLGAEEMIRAEDLPEYLHGQDSGRRKDAPGCYRMRSRRRSAWWCSGHLSRRIRTMGKRRDC